MSSEVSQLLCFFSHSLGSCFHRLRINALIPICDKYFTVLGILGNLRGKLRRKMDEICSGKTYQKKFAVEIDIIEKNINTAQFEVASLQEKTSQFNR
jgi:hypothetical protein